MIAQAAWTLVAAAAVLWPGRLSGPLDGVPLDGAAEAIVIGVALPALWWFHPAFLRTRLARALVLALIGSKAFTSLTCVQDGWCVRFEPSEPFFFEAGRAPHSWDIRADWRSADPACSAIAARTFEGLHAFPAWFFNLPPPDASWPRAVDRPPGATTSMTVSGFLQVARPGRLAIGIGPDMNATLAVDDGERVDRAEMRRGVIVGAGSHRVLVAATLAGDRWRFVPMWNDRDLWSTSMATTGRPSRLDVALRPWGASVTSALVAIIVLAWIVSASRRLDVDIVVWTLVASACIGSLAALGQARAARWSVAALAGAMLLRLPARLRNASGAFLLVGVPWLTLIVAVNAAAIGRFRLYESGNDHWMYQRFAYRIVMQGYWLEGGSVAFWFQPLYRWIVGVLHLVFGDSSVGEAIWDGACVLAMGLFAFHVSRIAVGFRWGLAALVLTLAVFALGTPFQYVGFGLSEISSAGFLYLAALAALRSRRRKWPASLAAGALASLGFLTRLNNLPMAVGVAAFALPMRVPAAALFEVRRIRGRVAWRTVAAVLAALVAALLFLAWRMWHYTGVFNPLSGTQAGLLAVWKPGMTPATALARMIESVAMTLSLHDPPAFDPLALPLVLGFIFSIMALARVPVVREVPASAALFSVAAFAGALVARGTSYPGRFSIHVIAITTTVTICAAGLLCQTRFTRSTSRSS